MNGPIDISSLHLALAVGLVAIPAVLSLVFRLGVMRSLAVGTVRTFVQLLAVGYLLRYIFGLDSGLAVIAMLLLMTAAASRAALARQSRRPRHFMGITLLSMVVSAAIVSALVTQVIIGVDPWYAPRYLIPITGMILGNCLNGIALGLDRLLSDLHNQRGRIEAALCLGATAWEASRHALRDALRAAMIPTINSLMVVGIVSLPGMMTGQILAGVDPLLAVKYQIVVMLMLAAGTAIGSLLLLLLAHRRCFDDRDRLIVDVVAPLADKG
jgi:putative ABC transport system permease protein